MRNKIYKSVLFLSVCLIFTVSSALADDPPPSWLSEAAKMQTPSYDVKNVPAVVLRNEESLTVSSDGTVVRTTRYAVRVLIREGREEAVARAVYETSSEKVRDIKAWLIRRMGETKYYGKKETIDLALVGNDLYNEARMKLIDASDETNEGDVFGFETVSEERNIFSQFSFRFQDDLPVIYSKFGVTLPDGWKAESKTLNYTNVAPTVAGNSYNWELRDLKPIIYEAGSPSRSSLAPRLAVGFYPSSPTATGIRTFANWNDVAKFMSDVEDPQMNIDDAMAAKVQELTANAKTEFEKIQAISKYVQQIQYISIQVGAGRGGGYRPHMATEVFAKSYGDCKDKANLMRAMLSILKIPSYMVSITADDPTYVRAEWASPHQFNHCIIAVKVSDETDAPTVVKHPTLGRLLIFDATDPYTPLGDLPEDEQGSLALIDHKDTHELIQMPILPADMNRLDRNIEVSLTPFGAISGKIVEKTVGQSATRERARLKNLSAGDYNQMIERWVSRGAKGAKATKISPIDNHKDGNFSLEVEFSADSYAQIMQNRLMVFKPAVIGRLDNLSFSEGKRMHPYMINSHAYSESIKIKIPEGFIVDEMPEPTKLETPFGIYSVTYEQKNDYILFTRSLKLTRSSVPADKYDSVRNFFGQVQSAEQAPIVLMKK
ncbi:MAG TPA: DUF3857 domain-containing protein [Pyrinomonadaceae bacterium]|nr:DUF3857 domain-containing protein [Pyrinomonadaceae bacterium]